MGAATSMAQHAHEHAQRATDAVGNMAGKVDALNAHKDLIVGHYQAALKAHPGYKAAVTGGGVPTFFNGGAEDEADPVEDLRDYAYSRAAKVKEEIVRGIARAVSDQKTMGFKVDPEADLTEVARQLRAALPSDGQGFDGDAKKHEAICKVVARALNDQFTPGADAHSRLIDTSASPEVICRQAFDYIHSLSTETHSELLEVKAAVSNAIRDLKSFGAMKARLVEKFTEKVNESADDSVRGELGIYLEALKRLLAESDRTLLMLENYFNAVIAPADIELAAALSDKKGSVYKALKRNNMLPSEYGESSEIAQVLFGLGSLASVAAKAHVALEKVGLGVKEFAGMSTIRELKEKLSSGPEDYKDIGAVSKAANLLESLFDDRSKIADAIKELPVDSFKKVGAAEDKDTDLGRKIKKRHAERKLVLKRYLDINRREYAALNKAIDELGPHIGRGLPAEGLDDLADALGRLGQVKTTQVDLSMIGFYTTARAREQKAMFLAHLRGVVQAIAALPAGAEPLGRITAAIEAVIKNIDYYSGYVEKKFGGNDDPVEGGTDWSDNTPYTGGAELTLDTLGLPEMSRSSVDLQTAIDRLKYFIYSSKIRNNLNDNKEEVDTYGSKYEKILGDAAAGRIQQLEREEETILEPGAPTVDRIGDKPLAADAVRLALYEATVSVIKKEYKVKKSFYRTIQAIDIYMKQFSNDLSANPSDVADIRRQLSEIQISSDWFTEATGDNLARTFDLASVYDSQISFTDQDHYYLAVKEAVDNRYKISEMAVKSINAEKLSDQIHKTFKTFQALRNLINIFARLGSRFGGADLRRSSFMTPTQMYRSLIEYLEASALSSRLKKVPVVAPAHAPPPVAPLVGVNYTLNGVVVNDNLGAHFVYMTPCVDDPTSCFVNRWKMEQNFFQIAIKAMCAKVMVVLGVYSMFEQPKPAYSLTSTRMYIGGAEAVEILPEATELYFRLPRLAEFYFELFKFDETSTEAKQVSMLPEVEGVYSGLISQVFVRSAQVAPTGSYSEADTCALIHEINKVYRFHSKEDPAEACHKAMHGLVAEVNRRYGVVKKTEWSKFQKLLGEVRSLENMGNADGVNDIGILPGEVGEESSGAERLAPSDRYTLGKGDGDLTTRPGEYDLEDPGDAGSMWNLIRSFRTRLSTLVRNAKPELDKKVSYDTLIDNARTKIQIATSLEEKTKVVMGLIQGSNAVATSDQIQSLMFHETVIVGLNSLSAVYSELNEFRAKLVEFDVAAVHDVFIEMCKEFKASPADAPEPTIPNLTAACIAKKVGVDRSAAPPAIYCLENQAIALFDVDNRVFGQWNATPAMGELAAAGGKVRGAGTLAEILDWLNNGGVAGANVGTFADTTEEDYEIVFRYLADNRLIYSNLLDTLYELSGDFSGLVKITYPGNADLKVRLDFSGLREKVESTLTDVRGFIEQFRPHFTKEIIARYEDASNVGSLFWLEENLVDKMLKGFTDSGGRRSDNNLTLDDLSARVNAIVIHLTKKYNRHLTNLRFDVAAVTATAAVVTHHDAPAKGDPFFVEEATTVEYGALYAEKVFWALDSVELGMQIANPILTLNTLAPLITRPMIAGGPAVPPPITNSVAAPLVPDAITHRNVLYTTDGNFSTQNTPKSMIFAFNQLIAMFIAQFYDSSSGKVYQGLLDPFANGSFSQSVMVDGFSQSDVNEPAEHFGLRGDPRGNAILLSSLTFILRRIMKDVTNQGVSQHLLSTLADVPIYMKENMRAALPIYHKMFKMLAERGEMLKEFSHRTKTNLHRYRAYDIVRNEVSMAREVGFMARTNLQIFTGSIAYATPINTSITLGIDVTAHPPNSFQVDVSNRLITFPTTEEESRASIVEVIDGIRDGCYTMITICEKVLRELADEPQFFETAQDSIQQYRDRTGKDQFAPPSLLTHMLNADVERRLPNRANNSGAFRFLYGTRGVLAPNGEISLSVMPGAATILTEFNQNSKTQIDKKKFEKFVADNYTLVRYLINNNYRKFLRDNQHRDAAAAAALEARIAAARSANYGDITNYFLAPGKESIATALETIESSFQDEKIADIVARVGAGDGNQLGGGRRIEIIANLIDMNIMPVNPHAFMRSAPLANLYNAAFTFDEMVCEFFGMSGEAVERVNLSDLLANGPKTAKETFVKLLVQPYAAVHNVHYGANSMHMGAQGSVARIARGEDGLALGRPKFISDQLWNKALFGSIYPAAYLYDENGPSGRSRTGIDFSTRGNAAKYLSTLMSVKLLQLDTDRLFTVLVVLATNNLAGGSIVTDLVNPINTAVVEFMEIQPSVTSGAPTGPMLAVLRDLDVDTNTGPNSLLDLITGGTWQAELVADYSPEVMAYLAAIADLLDSTIGHIQDGIFTTARNFADYGYRPRANRPNLADTKAFVETQALTIAGGGPVTLAHRIQAVTLDANLRTHSWFLPAVLYGISSREWEYTSNAATIADTLRRHALSKVITRYFYRKMLQMGSPVQNALGRLNAVDPYITSNPPTQSTLNPSRDVSSNIYMTYMDKEGNRTQSREFVRSVDMGSRLKVLEKLGKSRFDTSLVRNMWMITNLQRVVRAKLNKEMAQQRMVLVKGDNLVNPDVTEFHTNEVYGDREYGL